MFSILAAKEVTWVTSDSRCGLIWETHECYHWQLTLFHSAQFYQAASPPYLINDVSPLLHLGDALLQPGEGDVQWGQPWFDHAAQLGIEPNQVVWTFSKSNLPFEYLLGWMVLWSDTNRSKRPLKSAPNQVWLACVNTGFSGNPNPFSTLDRHFILMALTAFSNQSAFLSMHNGSMNNFASKTF